jgi:hypothetical protein
MLLGNANAVIFDGNEQEPVFYSQFDQDLGMFPAIFDSVVK